MQILFVSSEIYPYAKTGGLADVSSALPKSLSHKGAEVISVMPLYASIDREKHSLEKCDFSFDIVLNHHVYPCEIFRKQNVYFIGIHSLFDRNSLYGEYEDNGLRFGVFAYAVMELSQRLQRSWDVLHLNDWQSSLIAYLAKVRYKLDAKVIFTIHNLAFQGIFHKDLMDDLEIGWDAFTMHRFEFFDKINFLKGAIAYSDHIVAASPQYAKEIQTPEFGCGLDSFLRINRDKLTGILNGIDTTEFNPKNDPYVYEKYHKVLSKKKHLNKIHLLEELGLEYPERPLFVFIGRFAWQKGVSVILDALPDMAKMEINVIILGSGERVYNESFASKSEGHSNISVRIGYDEALARKIYAGGDFLIMPSVYEPCGLNQMIAMAYGCVPVVRSTGGLADSVKPLSNDPFPLEKGVGILFDELDPYSFLVAICQALALFANPQRYDTLISHNQQVDNGWTTRAEAYLTLYHEGDRR
ncbi:MAG: glycogen synthase [Sulfuricurvum sp.]|jgi:starch synthase